jgi:hypothetical protein
MADPTVADSTEQAELPDVTLRPRGTRGWVPPRVPGSVTVRNPSASRGKYQVKWRQSPNGSQKTIAPGGIQGYNTGGQAFSVKNTGTVDLSVTP